MKKMQVETNIRITIGEHVVTLTKSEANELYNSLGEALGKNQIGFKEIQPLVDRINNDRKKDEYDKWPTPSPIYPYYPIPTKPYEIWCQNTTSVYSGVQANPETI